VEDRNKKEATMATRIGDLKKMARAWAKVRAEEKALEAKRREIGERLTAMFKESGVSGVQITEREDVQLDVATKRTANKGDIVQVFGDAGEAFWAKLPQKTSEYLTVAKRVIEEVRL
jgi:DNA repair ATPase RecN